MLKNKYTELIPAYIGHYKILGKLGRGGMGDIYKAMQEPLNRIVALKVLPPQMLRDEEFAKRFEIEAKAISRLQHQNIVSIYEYGHEDSYRFIAMQFVDGTDLGRYIAEHRILPIQEIIDLSKQICRGLRYAHSNEIIHRDIKPQNVLLDKSGVARLSDFGIAKIFSATNITMTGSAVGTPEYMSPEQAQGKRLDAQTDIYSFGILMYEMLTRKPPFIANNPMAVAYKQVHEQPMPVSLKRKDTPKRLELIVLKAMKKEKKDRYASIEEVLEHLDSVDPTELVERTTVRFKLPSSTASSSAESKELSASERRITDRRQRMEFEDYPVFSLRYWEVMVKMHWITWLALAALATVFVRHVMNHP